MITYIVRGGLLAWLLCMSCAAAISAQETQT
jgi:hypothetical protein